MHPEPRLVAQAFQPAVSQPFRLRAAHIRLSLRFGRGRRRSVQLLLVPILAGIFLAGCSKEEKEPAQSQGEEKKAEVPSRVKHGTNSEVIITLDAATVKTMGLETAPLQAAQLSPEVKGYGHVLDTAQLTSLAADLVTAQAAAAASDAELKRVKALSAQSNASERALQTAEAAAARDDAQVQATRLRLLASWGSAIANRSDLLAFVQKLSSLSAALVELNLPAGEALPASPTGVRLLTLAANTPPIDAQFLGPASITDPQLQSKGFFFLVDPNSARLAPGAAVSGFLTLPGQPQIGVALPRDAVVQFNGATWIYRETAEATFTRIEVQLGPPLDSAWFVAKGFSPGEKVVTVGAQELLSEELKGQTGE